MNHFPTIRENTKILFLPNNEVLIILSSDLLSIITKDKRNINITKDAWSVLQYCDGKKDIKEILSIINSEFNISKEEILKFLDKMKEINIITMNSQKTLSEFDIFGDGTKYFPRHVSFRITEKCNLKCSYCYMGEPDSKIPFENYSKIERILEILKDNHVTTLEITGGEPMLFPEFDKVIKYAISNFELVTILTNGVYFPEKTVKYLTKFKNKVFIQISVDGSNEDVSYSIRRVKGTDSKTITTIKNMIQNKIPFRVAMVVNFENVKDIENAILNLKSIGVDNIVLTFSEELGNAVQNDSKSKTVFVEIIEKHGAYIAGIINKYSDIVNIQLCDIPLEFQDIRNCGAGSRSATVNHFGDVFPCVMLNEESCKMGNILNDNYFDVFNNSNVGDICRSFNLRSRDDSSCKDCEYSSYCSSCFVKVHIANKDRVKRNIDICEVAKKQRITELVPIE